MSQKDRYTVRLKTPDGFAYEIVVEPNEDSISVISGEIVRVSPDGSTTPVLTADAANILALIYEGLSVLTEKNVIIELGITDDIAIVSEVIQGCRQAFAAQGFNMSEISTPCLPTGSPFLNVMYLHTPSSIKLSFIFYPASTGHGGFSAMFVKADNHKMNVSHRPFSESSEEVKPMAHSFVTNTLGLLAKDFKPVLEGKEWKDMPIDWQGYK